MALFPAWKGSQPYTSSSKSSTASTSKPSIKIYTDQSGTKASDFVLCRRSPHSPFRYFQKIKTQDSYRLHIPDEETIPAPIPRPEQASPRASFASFFQREWKDMKRGRLMQSRIAAFSSAPVLILGSCTLLDLSLECKVRRRTECQRAIAREMEDWGDKSH